jgi:predicted SAM-dependent methyltransferase
MALLKECRRVLAPAGVARIVVPDGELYMRTYVGQLAGETLRRFPYQENESRHPLWTPMSSVNRVFYQDRESAYGHQVIYDFLLLQTTLRECGFAEVVRREFGLGTDPYLLIDTPDRQVESLYVEACGTR